MATGIVYLNDAEVEATYSLQVSEFRGWPGGISSSSRTVPMMEGPQMQGGIVDPSLLRRRPATATLKGTIIGASLSAGITALDALREIVMGGEVRVRSIYTPTRECVAVLTDFAGEPEADAVVNGRVLVSMAFTIADGLARYLAPDGYALTTGRTSCPIGTAESRPIITVHGGGASLQDPVITVRNAAGDIVQTMGFTVTLGSTAALRIDCTRMTASIVTAGVVTDALAASDWSSGDFPVLRPTDAFVAAAAYPTVELSATSGAAQGYISYYRRYV